MKNLINKLVLGTVQLGLDYGINNSSGRPFREEALMMLDWAYEKGITVFDTADSYGQAEEILGEFVRSRNLSGEIKIVTKFKPNLEVKNSLEKTMADQLRQSLKRLNSDYAAGYLLHDPGLIGKETIIKVMRGLKKAGLAKNIGVSIYEVEDAIYAAEHKGIDYIQVPYNILDQRLDKTDFFKLAEANGVTVFARSAFLQGLFFMPEEKIPASLAKVKIYLKELDRIIKKYGLSRLEAALMFSLNNDNIDYVVVGADNIRQLKEIIGLAAKQNDNPDCRRELKEQFNSVEKYIISPSLWKK
ncbi:hypothetical protein A3H09_02260 [Candidatus Falkowbacteria bacterium RIFCSPLOWO2_12_FULL_45_13]|uniref:NADP-dependent oxidoreductase domain-containing protein n=2 Tax=Candidatus Falkowiibacteriota TaxID=1752728 RepID=A0A1F5SCL5_9BACT|nr:MAG: hypothetical protein A3H66_01720 [Candidatus Falkowbacteria bacterium RIFCSPLOWO2_02_FULL_45_21]OGF31277.1 MAG: hypothetical protein A3H09_02260 [Candidatus Falkowbacteria bacterium RIFCSPLOWO2_12_FULL_45_13]